MMLLTIPSFNSLAISHLVKIRLCGFAFPNWLKQNDKEVPDGQRRGDVESQQRTGHSGNEGQTPSNSVSLTCALGISHV